MIGRIYLITNKLNNKHYVGQTTQPIQDRWRKHISANNHSTIAQAIQAEGKENFTIEELEQVEYEQLSNRELYWIQYYNSVAEGYNKIENTSVKGVLRVNHELICELAQTCTLSEIVEITGAHHSTISRVLKAQNIPIIREGTKFAAYSNEGILVQRFANISLAIQWAVEQNIKLTDSSIRNAVRRNMRSGGYYWRKNILPEAIEVPGLPVKAIQERLRVQ